MRISVERQRVGLLVGAGLLVVAIAAFLGYARYRVQRGILDLPGRLGATITRESNGYTYSQSDGKNTIFTIHAAKAVEHTDGKYALHDVNMILYGHKGDRADRISGSEFEYDTKSQVIRAVGLVHIDLEAPVASGTRGSEAAKHLGAAVSGAVEETGAGSRVMHVTTSGLTYIKALATASTDQSLEFAFGGLTGHAVGAEYNSDSGRLVLKSAVTVSGLAGKKDGGKPIALAASHGELDRVSNQADFSNARYSSSGEVAQAEMAHLHLRHDGTLERIEGVGRVTLEDAGQGSATSDQADVSLDAANKPQTAVLTGNVKFNDDEAFRQASGGSERAELHFDFQGRIDHAVLRGKVHTLERVRSADDAKSPWSERALAADTVDLILAAEGATGKTQLREAKATGSARLTTVATTSRPASPKTCGGQPVFQGRCLVTTRENLSGDVVQAHFVAPHGVAELSTVHGTGHTILEQMSDAGIHQISLGDTFDASFRQAPGVSSQARGQVELARAVQQGGVTVDRSLPAKSKAPGLGVAPDLQHATARMASYDADAGTLTMTGEVRMIQTGSTLSADKVVMEEKSQNATADGAIKVTYLQARARQTGAAEVVHVLATHAELDHDVGRATFYGRSAPGFAVSDSGLARLWQAGAIAAPGCGQTGPQGGSQIEAPVLVLEQEPLREQGQERKRLTARGERLGDLGKVHAALAYVAAEKPAMASQSSAGKAIVTDRSATPRQGVARVTSSQMVYSDLDREAVFTGGVHLLDADGEVTAQQATIYLASASTGAYAASKEIKPAAAGMGAATIDPPCSSEPKTGSTIAGSAGQLAGPAGIPSGTVERIVATQHVEITQPGRRATGDRLVYTANDQMYVLTGTPALQPKVVDAQQGTTTGALLRFHPVGKNVDVVVSGRDGDAPAQRVHTETRTKQK